MKSLRASFARTVMASAAMASISLACSADAQPPAGRGGMGGGVQADRPLVAQFDKNGDKRLDAAERKAAREFLATEPAQGGRGGRGGPGGSTTAGTPGPRVTTSSVTPVAATVSLYDTGVMRTLFLEFENADWEKELEAFKDSDVEVPATVTVDGKRYTNVGVHFRGNSSYSNIPTGSKRSLNLTFDFVDENQALLGYRTLNLLNANSDPTFVRTLLFSHIANQLTPAPKANLARVVINGESWGVYVNVQQFNKDFLRDFYTSTSGARWKVPGSPNARGGMEYLGADVAQYKAIYDIKTKDDAKSWSDLINLFRVLNETPADKLEAALAPILDVDGVLRFLAVDVALSNTDGYWTRASDYDIYQDAEGRFHVIPHDMNESLLSEGGGGGAPGGGGRGGRGGPPGGVPGGAPPAGGLGGGVPPAGGPPPGANPAGGFPGGRGGGPGGGGGPELDPLVALTDATKPLRSKLLAVPALRERYLGYVRQIAEKSLDWNTVNPLVTKWQSVVATAVAADTRKLYSTESFTTGLRGSTGTLEAFVTARRAYLLEHTGGR